MSQSLVVKDNPLIGSYCQFTEWEARLLVWCVAQIEPDDLAFKEYTLTRLEAERILNFNEEETAEQLKKLCKKMQTHVLKIKDPERFGKNGWEKLTIMTKSTYDLNKGFLTFKLHKDLKPYLLNLKENFTKLQFHNLMGSKS